MKTESMESRLLRLLRRKWVSPLEALRDVGCMSLAQRVSEWRREGMHITDRWVEANGKRFKSYRLDT
jgi:hypothetical protein